TLRVRELGLGYPSEELIRFRYCWGGCPNPKTNHGLVLARLKLWGGSSEELSGVLDGEGSPPSPCCRPSRYEDVAFLDERQRWHRLRQLSAAACRCLG
ncbi:PSPN protein, partial [Tricholaema leucomelas]|nr:PSPN protein [Tricholaema leucomelas]